MSKKNNISIRIHDFTAQGFIKALEQTLNTKCDIDCLESKILLPNSSLISAFDFSDGINLININIDLKKHLSLSLDYYDTPPLIMLVTLKGELTKQNDSHSTTFKSATQSIIIDKKQSLDKWCFSKQFEGLLILIDRNKYNRKIACYFDDLPDNIAELFKNTDNEERYIHKTKIIFPVLEAYESIINDQTSDIVRCNLIEGNTLEIIAFIIQRYKAIINNPNKINYKLSETDINNIQKARKYINKNYTKDIAELTIDKLAKLAMMNSNKFKKAYSEIYNESVRQSIIRLKLSKAKKLLLSNDKTIRQIANEVGYSNSSYFSKIFKQKLKIHPKNYSNEINSKLLA